MNYKTSFFSAFNVNLVFRRTTKQERQTYSLAVQWVFYIKPRLYYMIWIIWYTKAWRPCTNWLLVATFGIITTPRLYYFQAQADPVTVQPKSTNEVNAGSSDAIVLPPPTYDETPAPNKTGDTDADESTALNNGDKVGYTPGKWGRFVCISDN